jgi:putative flippase GtrA
MRARSLFSRWMTFNGVGLLGVAVQLTLLAFLIHVVGTHYLVATAPDSTY